MATQKLTGKKENVISGTVAKGGTRSKIKGGNYVLTYYNYLTTSTSVFKYWVAAPRVTLKMDQIKSLETRS